jgi:hypothetical protein
VESNLIVVIIYKDTKSNTVPSENKKETCLKQTLIARKGISKNFSTTSTDVSEISMTTDDDESETENELDPWIPLIEEAKQRSNIAFEKLKESLINSGVDEQSAKDKAYSNILPKLQKELENIYMERLLWMKQVKKDPVHKKIMHTKDTLVENDDFDPGEALEAAVDMRRFLIKRLLEGQKFDEENDDDD